MKKTVILKTFSKTLQKCCSVFESNPQNTAISLVTADIIAIILYSSMEFDSYCQNHCLILLKIGQWCAKTQCFSNNSQKHCDITEYKKTFQSYFIWNRYKHLNRFIIQIVTVDPQLTVLSFVLFELIVGISSQFRFSWIIHTIYLGTFIENTWSDSTCKIIVN